MMRGGSNNILEFRKVAPFTLSADHSGFAAPIVLAPCDCENHEQTPGFFQPCESVHEGLRFAARRNDDIRRDGRFGLGVAALCVALLGIVLGLG